MIEPAFTLPRQTRPSAPFTFTGQTISRGSKLIAITIVLPSAAGCSVMPTNGQSPFSTTCFTPAIRAASRRTR